MANLTNVAKKAEELSHDLEKVKSELKRVQSVKCRLKKQKALKNYEELMREVLAEEQLLKEVRQHIEPKKLTVTTMTAEDIAKLNYEETIRAIKSIQSKKCLVQYATERIEDNTEYQEAVRIEEMLKAHRATIKPVDEYSVQKSKINDLIEHLDSQEAQIDKEYIVELLKSMIQE